MTQPNQQSLDKRQIEKQFSRAASSYNQAAVLQKQIIEQLVEKLDELSLTPKNIVDLGCGTGLGLSALHRRFPEAKLTGIDIAEGMLVQAAKTCPKAELHKADIELLPLQDQTFDLVFSSSTLQWCDLGIALKEAARIIEPNGHLALAMFGQGTHAEWHAAWAETDQYQHTLEYPDQVQVAARLKKLGFNFTHMWGDFASMQFDSTREALRSVKDIGATNAHNDRHKGLMGKYRFFKFTKAFERLSPQHRLSYRTLNFVAQKAQSA